MFLEHGHDTSPLTDYVEKTDSYRRRERSKTQRSKTDINTSLMPSLVQGLRLMALITGDGCEDGRKNKLMGAGGSQGENISGPVGYLFVYSAHCSLYCDPQ